MIKTLLSLTLNEKEIHGFQSGGGGESIRKFREVVHIVNLSERVILVYLIDQLPEIIRV